ncbi:hypothetical protein SARC_07472 [Sphaeroforma arctica JP610]|uniref:Fibropellin-1 n=1 Tax=Sphaeroforma arctica JP610 TaxID=667725 RepID=A0A0L0FU25_9EUKA|nr:hypothetical protein SARC_07472 [Sphaeroforma arctica JP610]KNC80159.1 hypothetical protein SARC_07472 [Sphaeroforma arctica JP610]|eukprot:XP_014154061.1 hypothetical protein SARC_07472 [Sphaeroforma arctica JP610]
MSDEIKKAFMKEKKLEVEPEISKTQAYKTLVGGEPAVLMDVWMGDEEIKLMLLPAPVFSSKFEASTQTHTKKEKIVIQKQYTFRVGSFSNTPIQGYATLNRNGHLKDMMVKTEFVTWVYEEISEGFSFVYEAKHVTDDHVFGGQYKYPPGKNGGAAINFADIEFEGEWRGRNRIGPESREDELIELAIAREEQNIWLNNQGTSCPDSDEEKDSFGHCATATRRRTSRRGVELKIAEIQIDIDSHLLELLGGDEQDAIQYAASVINYVNGIYEEQLGITHQIVGTNVHTEVVHNSNVMSDLLTQHTALWKEKAKEPGQPNYDISFLLTGRGTGDVVGIAYIGAVCYYHYKTGVAQLLYHDAIVRQVALVAHELGHMWGCNHLSPSDPSRIMNSITTSSATFGPACVEAATAFSNSIMSCLDGGQIQSACVAGPCARGLCEDQGSTSSFTCSCPAGYSGVLCEIDEDECESAPCKNGGTCTDAVAGYVCACPAGYEGTQCEIDADECGSAPCLNGARCEDGVNKYTCHCEPGFEGPTCAINIDDCSGNPCYNDGGCIDGVNAYTCGCAVGYSGHNCEVQTDDCAVTPCANGGTCEDLVGSYKCTCAAGYSGTNCESNVNDCLPNPCQNEGVCIDGLNSYACNCKLGFMGPTCSEVTNECSPNPCTNGGTCVDGHNSYTCQCAAGFSGDICEVNIDECASMPCLNGGGCVDGINGYTCTCQPGFEGTVCEVNIDECSPNPCHNGGVCTDQVNGYYCTCPPGYDGLTCENDRDECAINQCLNGGACVDGPGFFTCTCTSGYTGGYCEIEVNECESNPCQNGAVCSDLADAYLCTCVGKWTGTNCETVKLDTCMDQLCQNGADCYDLNAGGYECMCQPGYSGLSCESDINECASEPCKNGAFCRDEVNGYACECSGEWTGTHCDVSTVEVNTDPCAGFDCYHGTCQALGDAPQCVCGTGYTGSRCSSEIDECLTSMNVCQNGATCVDGLNSVTCDCLPGYEGADCSVYACPCQNGGSCIDDNGSTVCKCVDGYSGDTCEYAPASDLTNYCSPDPCNGNGNCVLNPSVGFECVCFSGYSGTNCVQEVVPPLTCSSNPCFYGGFCLDRIYGVKCICVGGRTGEFCQNDVNECASSPCMTGRCSNRHNKFVCTCPTGWSGELCSTRIIA